MAHFTNNLTLDFKCRYYDGQRPYRCRIHALHRDASGMMCKVSPRECTLKIDMQIVRI